MATATVPAALADRHRLVEHLVNEKVASEILGVTAGTLSVWRCTRRVPLAYCKIGRAVRYRLSDLERFIADRTVGAVQE